MVSWTSPGVGAVVPVERAVEDRRLRRRNDGTAAATIVLARAWYPGWSAKLNGAPLVARPLAGLLVSVQLPLHSAGRLEVSFWPSGLTAGLVMAAAGAFLLGLVALFPRLANSPIAKLDAALSSKTVCERHDANHRGARDRCGRRTGQSA